MLPQVHRNRRFERDAFGRDSQRPRPAFPLLTPRAAIMNSAKCGIIPPAGSAWSGVEGRELIGRLQTACDQEQSAWVTREAKQTIHKEEQLALGLDCEENRQRDICTRELLNMARKEARKAHGDVKRQSRVAERIAGSNIASRKASVEASFWKHDRRMARDYEIDAAIKRQMQRYERAEYSKSIWSDRRNANNILASTLWRSES